MSTNGLTLPTKRVIMFYNVHSSLRELPALIFRNWVNFKQIYVLMLYIIYVIYVKYNYYTYILLKMQQTLSTTSQSTGPPQSRINQDMATFLLNKMV